jgi:diguanylate cyclase (GGDEF)-like protein
LAKEQKIQDAIALMDGALQEVESTRYPWLIADFRSVLSELKFEAGDLVSAESHANEAVSYGKQVASSAALVTAYRTLYRIQANKEKGTAALELYKRYAESQMAHQSDVKARELAYEIVRHETQQKNKEIELLQAQQRLERENTQKAQLTTLFLAILLAGIVFWAFQIKRHQQQLKKLAQTDSLTGLGNRHYFTQKSERSLVDAARAGEPASLVMFDLDHFKAINDTYGHGAGDWVLKQVGKTCSAHCRKIDYIGRIGGEEFAVLLRGIDLAGAARLAEDCRAQLAQIDTRDCGYSFVVTGSFGVSSTAQSGYDLSRLLSHADQMLYRAKNEGRNRVCAYTTEAAADHRSGRRSPSLSVVNR